MLGDESTHPRHALDAGIFLDNDALKTFIVVDGIILRALDRRARKHRGNLVPDLVGVLIRVDPGTMQIAVVVGCEAGDIDAGIAVGCAGHVSVPSGVGFRAAKRRS